MSTLTRKYEAELFSRIWDRVEEFSPQLAKEILKIGFTKEENERVRVLLNRNSEGAISRRELAELDSYIHIGDYLSILQSKARRILTTRSRNSHG